MKILIDMNLPYESGFPFLINADGTQYTGGIVGEPRRVR